MLGVRQQHQRFAETELAESGAAATVATPPTPSSERVATTPTRILRVRLMATSFFRAPGETEAIC